MGASQWLRSRPMQEVVRRRSPESLLAKLKAVGQARLHVYIGAAAGVGKTYRMLEEAHELKRQGIDVILALIEPHDRVDTEALMDGLERVPLKQIEYRGATFEEFDVNAVIARRPAFAIIDVLAHTDVPALNKIACYEEVEQLL